MFLSSLVALTGPRGPISIHLQTAHYNTLHWTSMQARVFVSVCVCALLYVWLELQTFYHSRAVGSNFPPRKYTKTIFTVSAVTASNRSCVLLCVCHLYILLSDTETQRIIYRPPPGHTSIQISLNQLSGASLFFPLHCLCSFNIYFTSSLLQSPSACAGGSEPLSVSLSGSFASWCGILVIYYRETTAPSVHLHTHTHTLRRRRRNRRTLPSEAQKLLQ